MTTVTTNQVTPVIPDEIAKGLVSLDRTERDAARAQMRELNEQSLARHKEAILAKELEKTEATQAKMAGAQAKTEAAMKGAALREWCRSGGKAADFEAQWPTLKAEILRRKVAEGLNNRRTVHF